MVCDIAGLEAKGRGEGTAAAARKGAWRCEGEEYKKAWGSPAQLPVG